MKVVAGLGNPGSEYDDTRHNVGWWVVDRLAYDWEFGPFEKGQFALTSEGSVGPQRVALIKPTTYMNRSGAALAHLTTLQDFDTSRDLLVVVDDAALEVGRVRFRASGGWGGHKGLESVCRVLGTDHYARLRIGVGRNPPSIDLTDWVLSPMSDDEEDTVIGLLPGLTRAVMDWLEEGIELTMTRHNR
jgi:PTH1 family peptidyl-tRNA hydrolase